MRQVAEYYSEYKQCFEGAGTNPGEKTLEDKFFEEEVGTGLSSNPKVVAHHRLPIIIF